MSAIERATVGGTDEFSGAPSPVRRGVLSGRPAVGVITVRSAAVGVGAGRLISVDPAAAAESIIRMIVAKSVGCGSRTTVSCGRTGTEVSGEPSPVARGGAALSTCRCSGVISRPS